MDLPSVSLCRVKPNFSQAVAETVDQIGSHPKIVTMKDLKPIQHGTDSACMPCHQNTTTIFCFIASNNPLPQAQAAGTVLYSTACFAYRNTAHITYCNPACCAGCNTACTTYCNTALFAISILFAIPV